MTINAKDMCQLHKETIKVIPRCIRPSNIGMSYTLFDVK